MKFVRLTDKSRGSVEAAFEEARRLGHDSLGDEDLLLGILRAGDGIGAATLSSLGVTLQGAREASEEMLSGALSSIGISLDEVHREVGDAFDMSIPYGRRIPFSTRARDALVASAQRDEEARRRLPRHRARPVGDTRQHRRDSRKDTGRYGRVATARGGSTVRDAWASGRLAADLAFEKGRDA